MPASRRYPEAALSGISGLHPQLRAFDVVPRPVQRMFSYQHQAFLLLVGIIACSSAMIDPHHILRDAVIIPVAIFAGAYGFLGLLHRGAMTSMADQRHDGDAALGPPQVGERHVGIAYSDNEWFYRGDSSWDRGYIRLHDWCLEFRGYGPGFRLPLSSITSLNLKATRSWKTNNLPHVYIHWRNPEGVDNAFSLEIRDAGSRRAAAAAAEDLQAQLQKAVEAAGVRPVVSPEWPFPSHDLDFELTPESEKPNRRDYLLAMGWAAIAAFAWAFLADFLVLALRTKGSPTVAFFSCFIAAGVYQGVLARRLSERRTQNLATRAR